MLYHMILPRAVNCWNDTHLMQVWDSYQGTRSSARHRRVLEDARESEPLGLSIGATLRCIAQDIKDQHSTSTNGVNLLALGSAAGRGDMSVVGHEPNHAKPSSYYGKAALICWLLDGNSGQTWMAAPGYERGAGILKMYQSRHEANRRPSKAFDGFDGHSLAAKEHQGRFIL